MRVAKTALLVAGVLIAGCGDEAPTPDQVVAESRADLSQQGRSFPILTLDSTPAFGPSDAYVRIHLPRVLIPSAENQRRARAALRALEMYSAIRRRSSLDAVDAQGPSKR